MRRSASISRSFARCRAPYAYTLHVEFHLAEQLLGSLSSDNSWILRVCNHESIDRHVTSSLYLTFQVICPRDKLVLAERRLFLRLCFGIIIGTRFRSDCILLVF